VYAEENGTLKERDLTCATEVSKLSYEIQIDYFARYCYLTNILNDGLIYTIP
jgi:hypothetical protein